MLMLQTMQKGCNKTLRCSVTLMSIRTLDYKYNYFYLLCMLKFWQKFPHSCYIQMNLILMFVQISIFVFLLLQSYTLYLFNLLLHTKTIYCEKEFFSVQMLACQSFLFFLVEFLSDCEYRNVIATVDGRLILQVTSKNNCSFAYLIESAIKR